MPSLVDSVLVWSYPAKFDNCHSCALGLIGSFFMVFMLKNIADAFLKINAKEICCSGFGKKIAIIEEMCIRWCLLFLLKENRIDGGGKGG